MKKKKANKKEKAETSGQREFYSFEEFVEHHGNNYNERLWDEYVAKQEDRYKLVEVQIFLKSKGKVGCAELVRSYYDLYSLDREEWEEFKAKPWDLRPTVGLTTTTSAWLPMILYQSDIAYLKFFEELKQRVEWKMSDSVACDLAEDTLKNYVNIDPFALGHAIEDCQRLSYLDALKDEMIPVYTTLWHEVVKKGRRVKNVLNEILGNDMRPYPRYKNFIDECLSIGRLGSVLHPLDQLKDYVATKTKEDHVDEDIKNTVRKFFEEEQPPTLEWCTYAKYVQKKMQVAKRLGIVPS